MKLMKLIGRTLAILAAALVVVGVLLAISSLGASATSTAAAAGMPSGAQMGHQMQSGFNLGGIIQILPALAVVGIITAIVAPIKQRLESKRRANKLSARRPLPTTAMPSI